MEKDHNSTPQGLVHGSVLFGSEADDADGQNDGFTFGVEREPAGGPDISELQARLDKMAADFEKLQQTNMMLMTGTSETPRFQAPPAAPEVIELPDPVDDAKGYAEALRKQIMSELRAERDAELAKADGQQKEQSRYSELWEEFQVKHGDYAKDLKKVRYAANIVAEAAQKRGLNMEKYMFTYRDQFMADVVKEMDNIFGAQKSGERYTEGDNRTDGIFGGRPASAPAKSARDDAPDNDPFKDIREFQVKYGFHR